MADWKAGMASTVTGEPGMTVKREGSRGCIWATQLEITTGGIVINYESCLNGTVHLTYGIGERLRYFGGTCPAIRVEGLGK